MAAALQTIHQRDQELEELRESLLRARNIVPLPSGMVTLEAQLQQEPQPAVVSDPAQMEVAIYLPPHLPCPTCKAIPYEKTVLEGVVAAYEPGTVFQEQTIARLQETNVGLTEAHEALKEAL